MAMSDLLEVINAAWAWRGVRATEVVAVNAFGNVLLRSSDGHFWHLCPEELSLTELAQTMEDMRALFNDPDFELDWRMTGFVQAAAERIGEPPLDHCYCLRIPAVLGGPYDVANVATIDRMELIRASGDFARQIEGLPDGTRVRFEFVAGADPGA
jgi:hypothetical protein